jgi:hypothetical protein
METVAGAVNVEPVPGLVSDTLGGWLLLVDGARTVTFVIVAVAVALSL